MTETRILKITTKGTKTENKQLWEMLEAIVNIKIKYAVMVGREEVGVLEKYSVVFED